jgi:uncharacterized protein
MDICGAVRAGLFSAMMATAWIAAQTDSSLAQTKPAAAAEPAIPRKQTDSGKDSPSAASHFTTGLVTGSPQSTEFAVVRDIATTLAVGQETGPRGEMALRVLPMVGNGGSRNVLDVLTLAGADMTISPVVLVDRLKEAKTYGDIRGKLVYVAPMFSQEFHLIVGPEIKTLADLDGKTVNLGEEGSAGAELGLELLNRLDVKFDATNLGLDGCARRRFRPPYCCPRSRSTP